MESKGRIVVIEDSTQLANLLEQQLTKWGYEVRVAQDGETGLALLCGFAATAVLCDIWLPGEVDGYAVAESIRSVPRWKRLPLIAMTAHSDTNGRNRSHDSGFGYHLNKPFEPETLKRLIDHVHAGE